MNDRRFGLAAQARTSFIASAGAIVHTLDAGDVGTSMVGVTIETRWCDYDSSRPAVNPAPFGSEALTGGAIPGRDRSHLRMPPRASRNVIAGQVSHP